jgi:gamma-glutamyl phosphate reductase
LKQSAGRSGRPMGLRELTTLKFIARGDGQIRE